MTRKKALKKRLPCKDGSPGYISKGILNVFCLLFYQFYGFHCTIAVIEAKDV